MIPAAAAVDRELDAMSIDWDLAPLPEPLPMPLGDLLEAAVVDALAYRLLACEALDRLRALTQQVQQLQDANRQLRAEVRV